MKSAKITEILMDGNIVIPVYFLKNFRKLKLDTDEFLFMMYLYNNGNEFTFDPAKISNDIGIDISKVLELISNLSDKDMVRVEVKENEKGFMEDIVSLDGFYNKLKIQIINEVSEEKEKEVNDSTIYEVIEKEFGRTLSPIEYEIIKAWTESEFSADLIKEAVKEAVFNGVSNLKYIDKILFEWGKKGITTVNDVEENRKKRKSSINNKDNDDNIDLDIVDWNWFDDE